MNRWRAGALSMACFALVPLLACSSGGGSDPERAVVRVRNLGPGAMQVLLTESDAMAYLNTAGAADTSFVRSIDFSRNALVTVVMEQPCVAGAITSYELEAADVSATRIILRYHADVRRLRNSTVPDGHMVVCPGIAPPMLHAIALPRATVSSSTPQVSLLIDGQPPSTFPGTTAAVLTFS